MKPRFWLILGLLWSTTGQLLAQAPAMPTTSEARGAQLPMAMPAQGGFDGTSTEVIPEVMRGYATPFVPPGTTVMMPGMPASAVPDNTTSIPMQGTFIRTEGTLPVHTGMIPACAPIMGTVIADRPCDARCWTSVAYQLWWLENGPLAAVLATSGASGNTVPGALNQSGTRALFGGEGLNYQQFSGLRITTGLWIDQAHRFGIEGSGFGLGERSVTYRVSGTNAGDPIIARPYLNAESGQEAATIVAGPIGNGTVAGTLDIRSTSRLWSWEVNGLYHVHPDEKCSIVLLAGYRMMQLDEDLSLVQDSRNLTAGSGLTFVGNVVNPAATVRIQDQFGATNRFNGAQVGARCRFRQGLFFVDATMKMAMGITHQQINIDGTSSFIQGNQTTTETGGLLAQRSNIGSYSQDRLSIIPEGSLEFGAEIRSWCLVRMGYNFLYWTEIARPGAQLDRRIQPSQVPTLGGPGNNGNATSPAFEFRCDDMWIQGLTFGIDFRF